jgi:hypothetical protein
VLDRNVRAVRAAVLVLGECMFSLDFLGHDPSPSRAPEGQAPGFLGCVRWRLG